MWTLYTHKSLSSLASPLCKNILKVIDQSFPRSMLADVRETDELLEFIEPVNLDGKLETESHTLLFSVQE